MSRVQVIIKSVRLGYSALQKNTEDLIVFAFKEFHREFHAEHTHTSTDTQTHFMKPRTTHSFYAKRHENDNSCCINSEV